MHRQWRGSVAALLGAGLLAAASVGQAQVGRAVADKLVVDDCAELGSCEWRLACKVGGGAETELIANASAGNLAEVAIGKPLPVKTFPVKVACTLWEDDGWFGASWKAAGSGSIELPAGGDYALELGKAGQGKVQVYFKADSLQLPAPPAAAPAPGKGARARPAKPAPAPRYAAVFQRAPEGRAVVVGLEWPAFQAKFAALEKAGIKLDNFHAQRQGDKWLWSGIFRAAGKGEQQLAMDLEWKVFTEKWKELYDKHLRLVDLETYDDGKKRLFGGIFRDGGDPATIWSDPRNDFLKQWEIFSGQGMRLVDLEIYRSGAKMFYAGNFRGGEGGYSLPGQLSKEAFLDKWKRNTAEGQRVLDLETYEEGGKRLYDAVMVSGGGADNRVELELDAAALTAVWSKMLGEGFRLVDLKTY